MDEFLESLGGGAAWGAGFGIAGLLVTGFGRGLRPIAKSVVKGSLVVGDWVREVTQESRESLRGVYEEAKTERQQSAEAAEARERQPAAEPARTGAPAKERSAEQRSKD
jgi:hypothetical protein